MIEVDSLTKEFRIQRTGTGLLGAFRSLFSREAERKVAVDNISFTIRQGECVGYIGPNGAGKSTTIKMLAGILHPTSGRIQIHGFSPQKDRKRLARLFGIVFGQRTQLWWDLPLRDSYEILRRMYKVRETDYRRFLEKYDHLLGIGQFLETPVRKLSRDSGCVPTWPPHSCTIPQSSFWTNPPSDWMWWPRSGSGSFFVNCGKKKTRPFCSPPTTWMTLKRCAIVSSSSITAKSSWTGKCPSFAR